MGAMFTATLDFGATPIDAASVVAATPGITAGAHVEAWAMRDVTADNNAEQHDMLQNFGEFSCGDIVPGTSVTIRCDIQGMKARGQFNIRGVWN